MIQQHKINFTDLNASKTYLNLALEGAMLNIELLMLQLKEIMNLTHVMGTILIATMKLKAIPKRKFLSLDWLMTIEELIMKYNVHPKLTISLCRVIIDPQRLFTVSRLLGNFLFINYTRKSSCVNARGIPPAAWQLLAVLFCLPVQGRYTPIGWKVGTRPVGWKAGAPSPCEQTHRRV